MRKGERMPQGGPRMSGPLVNCQERCTAKCGRFLLGDAAQNGKGSEVRERGKEKREAQSLRETGPVGKKRQKKALRRAIKGLGNRARGGSC